MVSSVRKPAQSSVRAALGTPRVRRASRIQAGSSQSLWPLSPLSNPTNFATSTAADSKMKARGEEQGAAAFLDG